MTSQKTVGQLIGSQESLQSKVSVEEPVAGLVHDSQQVQQGSLFFAIKGTRADGHAFIEQAFEKGATVAVVEQEGAFQNHSQTILVPSTRKALALAAARWFGEPTQQLALVGITGTNGKTTIAHLLRDLWSEAGLKTGLIGTVSNFVGDEEIPSLLTTPDPMRLQELFSQMASRAVTHVSMEVSSIALDQYRVVGSDFNIGLFTNLSEDHLDYHGDMEAYFQSKKAFFETYGVPVAVINIDDKWGRRLLKEAKAAHIVTYSLEYSGADYFFADIRLSKQESKAQLHTPSGDSDFTTALLGKHNLANCVAAIAVAQIQGIALEKILTSLASTKGAPGRLERVEVGDGPTVFVDYAHTPGALENVLELLKEIQGAGRIITVFGCGGDRDRKKRPLMGAAVSQRSDISIVTSDNPRTEDPERILDDIELGLLREKTQCKRKANRKEAIALALGLAKPEDIVLIAGKGHETYQIIGTQKMAFDDRQLVRDYYKER